MIMAWSGIFSLLDNVGGDEGNGNKNDVYEYAAVNETLIKRHKMTFSRGHAGSSTVAVSCGFIIAGGAINTGSSNERWATNDVS